MNYTLIIDTEKKEVRLLISKNGNVTTVVQTGYHGLRIWDSLIESLDREFGPHSILGEDKSTHSYRTFEYSNGVWVHNEPYEFLIDLPKENTETEETIKKDKEYRKKIEAIVTSNGYEIKYYNPGYKRISVSPPYHYYS